MDFVGDGRAPVGEDAAPVSDEDRAADRFAALMEAAPDATMELDVDGHVLAFNRRVPELFGRARGELLGISADDLVPGLSEVADTGVPMTGRHHDGHTFPIEVSLSRAAQGTRVATVRDMTAHRAGEESLRESETRLRQLAENSEVVFTLRQIDPPEYLYVSPSIEQLTGYRPEDLYVDPGLAVGDLIHPDDREKAARVRGGADDQHRGSGVEMRIVHLDGSIRWVRAVNTVVPHPSGTPQRVVGMAEDITERVLANERLEAAEERAREANEAKTLFLSRMSHELRTPLNAVLGFGQLLDRTLSGSAHHDSVRHILRAGEHLLSLIDDVLDVTRIEAGEMALSLEPVLVRDLAHEVLDLMRPTAEAAGVTLGLGIDEGPIFAMADAQRLRQVLINLVSNGVKYNRRSGHVRLSWTSTQTEVLLTVTDDGFGIAPELQARLFVPFDRLGAEALGIEGAGVGLALSQALVSLMNGRLSVSSQAQSGSDFTVALPRVDPPQPTAAEDTSSTEAEPTGHSPGSLSLLYVEDNAANVSVMQAVLELRPEWRLLETGLASTGLQVAREQHPDLVFLDLHLPDASGASVLERLMSDPDTQDLRVVALSADASPGTIRRIIAAGAVDYLTKPYGLDRLLEVLDSAARARST